MKTLNYGIILRNPVSKTKEVSPSIADITWNLTTKNMAKIPRKPGED